jgi:hypothetical protein
MTHQQQHMERFDCCGRVSSSFSYGTWVLYCVVRPKRLKLTEGIKSRRGHSSGSSPYALSVGHVLGKNPRFILNLRVSRFALWVFQVTFQARFFDTKFGQFHFPCIRPHGTIMFKCFIDRRSRSQTLINANNMSHH